MFTKKITVITGCSPEPHSHVPRLFISPPPLSPPAPWRENITKLFLGRMAKASIKRGLSLGSRIIALRMSYMHYLEGVEHISPAWGGSS